MLLRNCTFRTLTKYIAVFCNLPCTERNGWEGSCSRTNAMGRLIFEAGESCHQEKQLSDFMKDASPLVTIRCGREALNSMEGWEVWFEIQGSGYSSSLYGLGAIHSASWTAM